MAMSLASFRVRYPEFVNASDNLVNAALTEAGHQIDDELYGVRANTAHGWLTAHLIASTPGGQAMRLSAKDVAAMGGQFSTTYEREFVRLRDAAACAIRVF